MYSTLNINCHGSYLSENISRFPFANDYEISLINKGITGCGGTTIAIETAIKENKKIVLLMPTVSSVVSKLLQFPKIKGLYGSNTLMFNPFNPDNIIVATYDKFQNIKDNLFNQSEYYLVIDEYHTLTRDANYRKCMVNVLQGWDNFKSVTLLTATPDKYVVDAIQKSYCDSDITEINYEWNTKRAVYLHNIEGSVHNYLVDLVKNWNKDNNLYLMLNNVKEINKVIADSGVTDYHVLCSESRINEIKISSIDSINNNLKKINFITASGFEGCDIKDPTGVIYTLVDMSANSTIFDWQTLVQMQGRCRGSKEYPHILYHYSKLRDDQLADLKMKVKSLKLAKIELEDKTVKEVMNDDDYLILNGKIVINPFKESELERMKDTYEECQTYKSFFDYLQSKGYIINTVSEVSKKTKKQKGLGFSKLCKMYENGEDVTGYDRGYFVNKAYTKLGAEAIKKAGYKQKIVEGLLEMADNEYVKPVELLDLKIGRFYTTDSLVKALSRVNEIMKLGNAMQIEEESSYNSILPLSASYSLSTKVQTLKETLNSLGYLVYPVNRKINGKQLRGFEVIGNKEVMNFTAPLTKGNTGFKMTFSISTKAGVKINNPMFTRVETMLPIVKDKPEVKQNQWQISDCFNDSTDTYARKESSFNATNCMVIDVDDNGWTIETVNKHIETHFNNCLHYIYKTFSFTEEKQNFRIIIPLSDTIKFRNDMEDTKNFKKAKIMMFPEIHDMNCQLWFFSPNELPTQYGDSKTILNADYVRQAMDLISIHNNEETNIIEIKVNEPKKKMIFEEIEMKNRNVSVITSMINDCVDGEWNNKIWAAAYYVKKEDIDEVKNGIIDPAKLRYFEEKLKYKRN